jgi:hypothetical protein
MFSSLHEQGIQRLGSLKHSLFDMSRFRHRLGRTERKNGHCDTVLPDPENHSERVAVEMVEHDWTAGRHDRITNFQASVASGWYDTDVPIPPGTFLKFALVILRTGFEIEEPMPL